MPTIQSAKQIAENALSTIGAFPASRSQPDPGEMKRALRWLEMLLNHKSAVRPIDSFFQTIEIPLEAGVGDYELSDYTDERGACHVFSVSIVDQSGDVDPLDLMYQSSAALENLKSTGRPSRVTVTHDQDEGDGVLRAYPEPTQTEQDAGLVMRVRIQTFHEKIDETGTGDTAVRLRPSWYLWATKALSYQIGSGPVRRLSGEELKTLKEDSEALEGALLARDGQHMSPRPPVTEPMDMSVDDDYCGPYGGGRSGYRRA